MDILKKIQAGEGRKLEFKVAFTSPVKIAQTVVAFANGAGGEIVFGIADGGVVKGLEAEELPKLADQLSNLVYETCYPLVMIELAVEYIEDMAVLLLKVFPGADKPYFLKKLGKQKGVFIRAGASTRNADMSVIAELERRKRNISFDEEIAYDYTIDDLDLTMLKKSFQEFTGKKLEEHDLCNLSVLKNEHGVVYPTVGGVLLAGTRVFNEYCGIKCARFKGTDTLVFIDKKEYSGPLFLVVEEVLKFAKNHIPLHGEIQGIQRVEQYEVPMLALREAVLNAVVHRDYTIDGADVKVAIFDDIIEITSPGCLPNTLDVEDILTGRSEIRNKVIARFFEKIGFIEKWGTGIKKIVSQCQEYGLPTPEFKESGNFFQVVLHRKKSVAYNEGGSEPVHGAESRACYGFTPQKGEVLRDKIDVWLAAEYAFKAKPQKRFVQILLSLYLYGEIVFVKNASKRTCEYDLKQLKESGLITFVGARKNGHYELTERTVQILNNWRNI